MRKPFLVRTAAVLAAGVLSLSALSACERHQVVLDSISIQNFTEPQIGDEIVVLTVRDYGDVTIRLFPEESPKGVENFKTLVEQGYYDELIFHRVIKDFVIQSGDPKGDTTGGDDCWGTGGFAQTISPNLCHFTGAVAYATASDKLNNSQFYIVTGAEVTDDIFAKLKEKYGRTFSDPVKALYKIWGGQPYLDENYEVFGQVIGGMDICLAIQNVETNSSDKPKSQVVIDKAVVQTYQGGAEFVNWEGNAPEQESSGKEG